MLCLDLGSKFLWSKGLAAKSDFFEALMEVIADCQGASGKQLRNLQTDGDGIFKSETLKVYLQDKRIRHLWSAPYDSDTNPFIERERRTILEGTSTSLFRAGAPSNFWREAEAHKIFTINVLPVLDAAKYAQDTMQTKMPDNKYISRQNLIEKNPRTFKLQHLMPFGTACICLIPTDIRTGNKTPGQKKSFPGAIVGYAEEGNMQAYRVWDFDMKKIRNMSFSFTVCQEGFYPFRDKNKWLEEWGGASISHYPTLASALSPKEWAAYGYSERESAEAATRST